MSGTKNLFTIFQTTWPTGGGKRARGGRWEEGGACPVGVVEQVKIFKMFQDGQFWIDVTALMNIY